MKENYVYPIKIEKDEEGGILISAPDFPGQMTEAKSEEDVIKSAQEMLAICIIDNEEQGKENPTPTAEGDIKVKEKEKIIYVHLWMPYFRNMNKEVYVKKTLTIPSWLDILAKEKNVNFSAALVKSLKEELGIITR